MAPENFFTRKIGPLPAWGWGAAAAGGFVLYRFWKNRTASSSASGGTAAPTAPSPTETVTTPSGSYSGPESGLSAFFCLLNPSMCGSGAGATASSSSPPAGTQPPKPPPKVPTAPASTIPIKYPATGNTVLFPANGVVAVQPTDQNISIFGNPSTGAIAPAKAGISGGLLGTAPIPTPTGAIYPLPFGGY